MYDLATALKNENLGLDKVLVSIDRSVETRPGQPARAESRGKPSREPLHFPLASLFPL